MEKEENLPAAGIPVSEIERQIRNDFKPHTWNDIKTNDSWTIFKVMSEFVSGFDIMARIGPCVSIFGSARIKPGSKYYRLAEQIAYRLTGLGFGIITGGGPGIMEAANQGRLLRRRNFLRDEHRTAARTKFEPLYRQGQKHLFQPLLCP